MKITVSICCGATCDLMGASHLQDLREALPEGLRERVELAQSRCFGLCRERTTGTAAPCARVDGKLLERASLPDLLREIENIAASRAGTARA